MNSLETELMHSGQLVDWIQHLLDGIGISSQTRYRLAGGCLHVALEHHGAIRILSSPEFKLYGSAWALVRIQLEAYLRGSWLAYCANDNQLSDFQNDELKRKLPDLIKDLEAHEAFRNRIFSDAYKTSWKLLCSFTHTGINQVAQKHTVTAIDSNYVESGIVDLLSLSNALALFTALAIADIAKRDDLIMSVRDKAISYVAGQRY